MLLLKLQGWVEFNQHCPWEPFLLTVIQWPVSLPQPSLVALAVLGCDLKLLGCDWLTVVVTLQTLAQVRGGELSVCYEAVAPHYSMAALRYPLAISSNVTDKIKEVGITSSSDSPYPRFRETDKTWVHAVFLITFCDKCFPHKWNHRVFFFILIL